MAMAYKPPQNNFDYITSDSDEESFVVLGSSIPQDSLITVTEDITEDLIDTDLINRSIENAEDALKCLKGPQSDLPSLPKVSPVSSFNTETPDPDVRMNSNISDLSLNEIQQKVENLVDENTKLKDALIQNHLTLKKQYETIAMWNEDVKKVHEIHKQQFAETKTYVEKLKQENAKLKDNYQTAQTTIARLKQEVKQETNIETEKLLKNSFDNLNKFELENAQKKIACLEKQITELQISGKNAESLESLSNQLAIANCNREELKRELSEEHKQSVMKQSKLIEEIEYLKKELKTKLVSTEEDLNNVKEQLMKSQIHITELLEERRKDKENLQKKEMELASLRREMESPQNYTDKNGQIKKLEDSLKELKGQLEMYPYLQEQLEIYRKDFEAEREAKNAIMSEKHDIVEDLRNLHRRNQSLLEENELLKANAAGARAAVASHSSSNNSIHTASAAFTQLPHPKTLYECPKCTFKFANLQALQNHVERCLEDIF